MNKSVGVLLILGGIFLVLQYFNLLKGDYFLFYLSGGFLLVYYLFGRTEYYGNIGFLIPGCVLLSIASYAVMEEERWFGDFDGGFFFIFLALAFFAVFLHTRTFRDDEWTSRNWPAIPGVCLLIFGGLIFILEATDLRLDWPKLDLIAAAILIGLGIHFLIKGNRKRRSVRS